jgi:heat shock protein HslJ
MSEQTLTGTRWQAEDLDGGGTMHNPQATLEFPQEGGVAGSGGCNRYFGSADIDGPRIQMGPLASTRRACAPAVMAQEGRFFGALERARTWQLVADKLLLRDEGGAPLLQLQALGDDDP